MAYGHAFRDVIYYHFPHVVIRVRNRYAECSFFVGQQSQRLSVHVHFMPHYGDHRWIPLTKARDAELWCFLWSAPEHKLLNKQSRRRRFETPSRSPRRHCLMKYRYVAFLICKISDSIAVFAFYWFHLCPLGDVLASPRNRLIQFKYDLLLYQWGSDTKM